MNSHILPHQNWYPRSPEVITLRLWPKFSPVSRSIIKNSIAKICFTSFWARFNITISDLTEKFKNFVQNLLLAANDPKTWNFSSKSDFLPLLSFDSFQAKVFTSFWARFNRISSLTEKSKILVQNIFLVANELHKTWYFSSKSEFLT
jgi:hypothetical protein